MTSLLATAAALFLGSTAILLGTVFVGIFRAGPSEVSFMRRKGYGVRPWATGSLPSVRRGTTASELEGLEMRAENGRLVSVRRTRAPSTEIA